MGEKDATEPKRGANAVVDGSEERADAPETRSASDAAVESASTKADHAATNDFVNGDEARVNATPDGPPAGDIVVTDDARVEDSGVAADLALASAAATMDSASPQSEDIVADDTGVESGAAAERALAEGRAAADVFSHDVVRNDTVTDEDTSEAAVSDGRPEEEVATVAAAPDLAVIADSAGESRVGTTSDRDMTEAAGSDVPLADDFDPAAIAVGTEPTAEPSREGATTATGDASLEANPATDQAATADVAAEDAATDTFEAPERASAELKAILEALIFASPEPLSLKALTKLLDSEPKEDVATALVGLKDDYERPGGLQLVEIAGGYQIVTRHDLHEWVRRLFHERSTQKLSAQALETLAVVAYRQPITAVEITEIRGVNTSGVLNTLLERHLIKIVGRKAVVGRPFMYSTTKEFLIRFGLNDLTNLPRVEDMVDALGLEAPLLVEQVPVEDQLPLEEPDAESDEASAGESGEAGEPGDFDESEEPRGRGGPDGSVH